MLAVDTFDRPRVLETHRAGLPQGTTILNVHNTRETFQGSRTLLEARLRAGLVVPMYFYRGIVGGFLL